MQIKKSKKQPLTLSYDNLIVGSSLEAVFFAYQTSTPLISTRMQRPFFFEELNEDFGIGLNKLESWNKYIFILGLVGLTPLSDKIKHIRYLDANNIKAVTLDDTPVNIKFNRLFIFDDHAFYDLPTHTGITTKDSLVVDWMKVLAPIRHQVTFIDRENKFMNKIFFYDVGYQYSAGRKKDCLSVSYLTESQTESDKYADYVVRLKTEKVLKENISDKIVVEHLRRDIIKLGKNTYDNFDNVIFMDCEPKTAWQFGNKRSKINYQKYLNSKLGL